MNLKWKLRLEDLQVPQRLGRRVSLASGRGHVLAYCRLVPWRGAGSLQSQMGPASWAQGVQRLGRCSPGALATHLWTMPALCLLRLFDLGIAKPLTYSASLVSSEVVALMGPARVEKIAEEASGHQRASSPARWVWLGAPVPSARGSKWLGRQLERLPPQVLRHALSCLLIWPRDPEYALERE